MFQRNAGKCFCLKQPARAKLPYSMLCYKVLPHGRSRSLHCPLLFHVMAEFGKVLG